MSTLHAPASVFPFQTPARFGAFAPSTAGEEFRLAWRDTLDAISVAEAEILKDFTTETSRIARDLRGGHPSTFAPSTGCTTFAPNAAHECIDADTAAEMNSFHDDTHLAPTGDDLDAMYDEYRVELGATDGADGFFAGFVDHIIGDDGDRTPPPAAGCVALPRTLDDDTVINLLQQADDGDPRGHLLSLGIRRDALPDFAAACAAEIVARLDRRTARLAA